jgi:hypothetical protein
LNVYNEEICYFITYTVANFALIENKKRANLTDSLFNKNDLVFYSLIKLMRYDLSSELIIIQ